MMVVVVVIAMVVIMVAVVVVAVGVGMAGDFNERLGPVVKAHVERGQLGLDAGRGHSSSCVACGHLGVNGTLSQCEARRNVGVELLGRADDVLVDGLGFETGCGLFLAAATRKGQRCEQEGRKGERCDSAHDGLVGEFERPNFSNPRRLSTTHAQAIPRNRRVSE